MGRSDPKSAYQPDVALTDDAISRRHLEFRQEADGFVVVDVESTNGTWLNGQELAPNQPHPLQPGDRILLGCETELVFGVGAVDEPITSLPAAPAANLERELAAARMEIRALQEELARERRLSEVDGSALGQRTLGQIARELEEARRQLAADGGAGWAEESGVTSATAPRSVPQATEGTADALEERLAALTAEIEQRQAELEQISERHACLERHWGERLRQLDQLLAAEQAHAAGPDAVAA